MSRTLIKTTANGWFINSEDLDGQRVRKAEGDNIVTREQWDAMKAGTTETETVEEQPVTEAPAAETNGKPVDQANAQDAAAVAPTQLSSGKLTTGKTVTIKCAWVDPEKRTKKQQKLFEGPTKDITYEKVVKAAGDDASAKPCGVERVIKKQDEFQVRFCTEHFPARRNELRRMKLKAKRAAADAKKS